MKKFKSIISIILVIILVLSCFMTSATAEEIYEEPVVTTVRMMNFNVAGLPKLDGTDGSGNTAVMAEYINSNNFDIVAVQEDFSYHNSLVSNLNGYNYQTNFSGNIPGGDGLNVFTKNMPIYNEGRYQWIDSYGDISEGDTLTPKGILYSVIYIGDGIYVDFYDIHADAFDGDGSIRARESNYRQLMALVEENSKKYNRPIIITGDFNHFLHAQPEINSNMYSIFHENGGFRDAWIEVHNNGDYFNFSEWFETGTPYWGEWDSVEKFLYRNGGGIEIDAVDFKYTWIKNAADEHTSDHAAAECTFQFTKTNDFVEMNQDIEVVKQHPLRNVFNTIKWILKDLYYILSNIDQLIDMIK